METQTSNIQQEIRKADTAFEQTFGQGDSAKLARFYSHNAMLLPPGNDLVQGTQAIERFWQGAMEMGVKEAKLDIEELEHQGDAVIEMGRYRLKGSSGDLMDQGKYIVVWKEEDGHWKMHRDIWNSNQPSA